MIALRFVLTVAGFASVFVAPPWVPVIFMIALSLRFRAVECIGIGLFADLIWYGAGGSGIFAVPFFTIMAIVVVWILEPFRLELIK